MTPEEYAAAKAAISAAAVAYAYQILQAFKRIPLTPALWSVLVGQLFIDTQHRRRLSAELGRRFYDSERDTYWPDLPKNPVFLDDIDFEYFAQKLEPERILMSQEDTPDQVIGSVLRRLVREVENGGRRTIIRAVENDDPLKERLAQIDEALERARQAARDRNPEPEEVTEDPDLGHDEDDEEFTPVISRPVRGWARVATGAETCAFCLAMVSRGAVYLSAENAGLDLNNTEATDRFLEGEDMSEFMKEWHTGCDCTVVPVFDRDNWPGKQAADDALKLWNEASKEAERLIAERPRKHSRGENKGEEFTLNEEALLALRRRLERGDINPNDYAFFNAA